MCFITPRLPPPPRGGVFVRRPFFFQGLAYHMKQSSDAGLVNLRARPSKSTHLHHPYPSPVTLQHSIYAPVGPSTAQKRAAHAARRAAAILNIAPPMTELQSDHILPLPPGHASPLAPHVVAKFTAWLQEDNHPNRALCQEDSEVSPRPICGRNFDNHCTLILSVAHRKHTCPPRPTFIGTCPRRCQVASRVLGALQGHARASTRRKGQGYWHQSMSLLSIQRLHAEIVYMPARESEEQKREGTGEGVVACNH
jgi:hypothetical protein